MTLKQSQKIEQLIDPMTNSYYYSFNQILASFLTDIISRTLKQFNNVSVIRLSSN